MNLYQKNAWMKAQWRLFQRDFFLYYSQTMKIYLTEIAKEEGKINLCRVLCMRSSPI